MRHARCYLAVSEWGAGRLKQRVAEFVELVAVGLSLVAVPSFLFFLAVTHYLGGDAINGGVLEGRYFLGNRKGYIEVPMFTYYFSWGLGWCTIFTFLPMVLLGGLSTYLEKYANTSHKTD
ncbi:hypothetical protein SAMN05444141_10914 [Pseudovibrio denitrificans]|uniref:Uncharacterized protein n=1 Tax=Pseudovibrio denitrificans TaxID=258256 RepID=A0A1I7DJK1_9HYPH|nr:hypothetical protein [Pseudovibrio denitrificans]SFU11892.1 hypothetical protein SAMN05444141_10914 [Pseudovibrio denitrificans]